MKHSWFIVTVSILLIKLLPKLKCFMNTYFGPSVKLFSFDRLATYNVSEMRLLTSLTYSIPQNQVISQEMKRKTLLRTLI